MLISSSDKIFVAGHNGMVGNSIKKKLKEFSYKNLLIPGRKELDLLDNKSVENWFKENKPEVVIIAAAKVGGINANKILNLVSICFFCCVSIWIISCFFTCFFF